MDFGNIVLTFGPLPQWLGNKDDAALKASQDVGQTNRIIIKATQKANSLGDFRRKGGNGSLVRQRPSLGCGNLRDSCNRKRPRAVGRCGPLR